MHANKREEIKEVYAGDIAAAVGLKQREHRRHAVRREEARRARVDGLPGAGHLARDRAEDQERPGKAGRRPRQKLMAEDPTFRVKTDEQTGQVVIAGMGELHLEIIVDRLKREFSVEASVGKPQVAYKETLTRPADGEMTLRQADRRPRPVRPRQDSCCSRASRATGYIFENDIVGGTIPQGIHQADRRRHQGSADARRARRLSDRRRARRALRRFVPRRRLESEMAFKIAGSMAFQDAAKKAQAGAARAGHAGRGGGARRVHGRHHRRPDSRAAAASSRWKRAAARRSSTRACRCRRCSATRRKCGRARRAAPPTRCTSIATNRRRASVSEEVVARIQGK